MRASNSIVCGLLLALLFAAPVPAAASTSYPQVVKDAITTLPCVPTCLLCHVTMAGLVANDKFGKNLKSLSAVKLGGENPDTLRAALQSMAMPANAMLDADGDGKGDWAELSVGDDPNDPTVGASLCETVPLYGCGASVAAVPAKRASDPAAAVAALLTALAGVLALRRRSR